MSDVLSFNPNRALTANIDAAAAARAFFYDAGTTTLRTVYADSALTTPHASPLVANAAGIFPAVYVDGAAVKVVAQDAAGATLYTLDPCVKVAATGATAAQVSFAPSTAAPYTNVQAAIDDLATVRSGGDADRIINGDFGIWQRATTSTAAGYVAADRWNNNASGGTVTQSRQAFPLGDMLGGNCPQFYLRQAVSGQTLAAHFANTLQKIEGVRSYAGQTVTLLGWARLASGAGNMVVEAEQFFGTGGSGISGNVTGLGAATVTLGAAWAPFAASINIPSISGKTLGSNGNDFLQVNFWTSAGSDWNARTNSLGLQTIGVDFWGIHIRAGTWTAADAALYRPRDPGTELALCQRYFEVVSCQASGTAFGATSLDFSAAYRVTKRAAPQVTAITQGTWFANNGSGTLTTTGITITTVSGYGFSSGSFTGSVAAGVGAVLRNFVHYADAEL